ncbi:MAG: TonB-dependent receptor [Pseudomonadales bacterium]
MSMHSMRYLKKTLPLMIAAATAVSSQAFAQGLMLEEVVVTAQKRTENIQDVPISITAYSAEGLEKLNVRNLTDVGRFTPGVEMNNDNALQPTYSIRGIQTSDWTIGSDPSVAVYVDGVYSARAAGAETALADVARVEILKGPQGTLFGRNATGGAIHIISALPEFENGGRIKLTGGNYDRRDAELMGNFAASDTLAFRANITTRNRDGYLEDLTGGKAYNEESRYGGRLSMLWQPSDATSVVLRADMGKLDQQSAAQYTAIPAVFESANLDSTHDDFGDITHDSPAQEYRDMWGASMEINHTLSNDITFTSITGYRDFETKLNEDLDGSNNLEYEFFSNNPEQSKYISQEFRFTGSTDSVNWTAGASYSNEDVEHITKATFNYSTLENFAVYTGIKDSPLGDIYSEQELAGLLPGLRQANQANVNAMQLPYYCEGGPYETNCDGIVMASFLYSFLGDPTGDGTFQGIFPWGGNPYAGQDPGDGIRYLQEYLVNPITNHALWPEQVDTQGDYTSWAIYGDATWAVNEKMNLTGGLRYTLDKKDFAMQSNYQNYIPTAPGFPFPVIPLGLAFFNNGNSAVDTNQSDEWDALSGRLVLDYLVGEDTMLYGSIATGFKSGGFNSLSNGPGIENSFDAEEVINYEIGSKGTYLDGALQLNAALFFYDYTNLQELSLIGQPIPTYQLRNADAEGKGLEVEFNWRITEGFRMAGNYSYLDTEYTKYNIIEAAGETEEDDKTGQPRVDTPKNKVNLLAEYVMPVSNFGDVSFRIDWTWVDERPGDDASKWVDSYSLTNARVDFMSENQRWGVSGWVTNLADTENIQGYGGNGEAIGSLTQWRLTPRMYGMDVVFNF